MRFVTSVINAEGIVLTDGELFIKRDGKGLEAYYNSALFPKQVRVYALQEGKEVYSEDTDNPNPGEPQPANFGLIFLLLSHKLHVGTDSTHYEVDWNGLGPISIPTGGGGRRSVACDTLGLQVERANKNVTP